MTLLYKASPERGLEWERLIAAKAPELEFRRWPDIGDPAKVKYLAAWVAPDNLATDFPNLEVLFSTGAGVDQHDLSKIPPGLPLVRMVESGIIDTMVEYVTMAVLAQHRDLVTYVAQQREAKWHEVRVYPAAKRRVGILGLGMLGQSVCRKLVGFGFQVAGWSRSRHDIEGVTCYAGEAERAAFLARSDILVCLVPLTRETRHILNGDLFAQLPKGARLVNAGRGAHLDQEALLAALDSGQIASAILDVTTPEPLPAGHPLWRHPNVLITPHVASMTQPETAVDAVLENIRRHEAGEPMIGLVDRTLGY